MTNPPAMAPLRRGPIPGMTTPAPHAATGDTPDAQPRSDTRAETIPPAPPAAAAASGARRSEDYSATRLVSFRLPVDLHDHYKALLQDLERQHPRLRRPSLTEIIIGLLEEAPDSVDEVADIIRRKRASEYSEEPRR